MRVEEYPKDHIITDQDEFFGSDGNNNKKTVNFKAVDVAEYVREHISDYVNGVDQNNLIRVIKIPSTALEEVSADGLANYINSLITPLVVGEKEIIVFEIDVIEPLDILITVSASFEITNECDDNSNVSQTEQLFYRMFGQTSSVNDVLYHDVYGLEPVSESIGVMTINNEIINFKTDAQGQLQLIEC